MARDEKGERLHQAPGADPRKGSRQREDCSRGMETRAVAGGGRRLLLVAAPLLVSRTGWRRRLASGRIAGDRASHRQRREGEETPCGRQREYAFHRAMQLDAGGSHSSPFSGYEVSFQVHAHGASKRRPRPPSVSPRGPPAPVALPDDAPLLPIPPSEPFARPWKSAADGARR
jgi:hypothetical protein